MENSQLLRRWSTVHVSLKMSIKQDWETYYYFFFNTNHKFLEEPSPPNIDNIAAHNQPDILLGQCSQVIAAYYFFVSSFRNPKHSCGNPRYPDISCILASKGMHDENCYDLLVLYSCQSLLTRIVRLYHFKEVVWQNCFKMVHSESAKHRIGVDYDV